jgi:GTP-binding protein
MAKENVVHIAIVGRPNVGKSTLFNRLVGKRKSITDAMSGTTRDRLYERISIRDKDVYIIDTGGIQYCKDESIDTLVDREVNKAIIEATLIIFLCDQEGLTSLEYQLVDDLRHRNKKVLLVVNKVDGIHEPSTSKDFYSLGFGAPIFISALHGNNLDALYDMLYSVLPEACTIPLVQHEFRLAFVGEPNAGKSTLLNSILNDERVVVSDVPGTTRDFVEETLTYKGKDICLVDTAGIKKKKKMDSTAGIFSLFRSEKVIKNSDIIFLLLDASKGPQHDTRSIYKMILDMGKACVLVVNKWDLVSNVTMEAYSARIIREYGFFKNIPIIYISAKTGRNVQKLMDVALHIWENYTISISTSSLNSFLEDVKRRNPPPSKIKFKYIVQVNIKPPTFVIFVRNKQGIPKNYMSYLLNTFIDVFNFQGTIPSVHLKEEKKEK